MDIFRAYSVCIYRSSNKSKLTFSQKIRYLKSLFNEELPNKRFHFQISELNPQVMQMGAVCLVSCLVIRVIATFLVSFGCGLNNKEKLFIGLTWMAKATVQVR